MFVSSSGKPKGRDGGLWLVGCGGGIYLADEHFLSLLYMKVWPVYEGAIRNRASEQSHPVFELG